MGLKICIIRFTMLKFCNRLPSSHIDGIQVKDLDLEYPQILKEFAEVMKNSGGMPGKTMVPSQTGSWIVCVRLHFRLILQCSEEQPGKSTRAAVPFCAVIKGYLWKRKFLMHTEADRSAIADLEVKHSFY